MNDYNALNENVDAINHIIATAGKLEEVTGIPADDLLERTGYGGVSMDAHIASLNRYLSSKRELAAVTQAIDTGNFVIDENATDADIRKAYNLLEKRKNYLKTVAAEAPEGDDALYIREDVSNALVAAMIEKQVPPHILSAYRQNVDEVLGGGTVCLTAEKPTKGKTAKYLLLTGVLAAALGLSGCIGDSPTGSTVPSDAAHAVGPQVFHEDTGVKYAGKGINVFVPTDGYLDDDDLHDNIDVYGDRSLDGEGLPYGDVRRVKVVKDDNGFVKLVALEGTPGNEMRIYDNNHDGPIDRVEMDLATNNGRFVDGDGDGVWDVAEDENPVQPVVQPPADVDLLSKEVYGAELDADGAIILDNYKPAREPQTPAEVAVALMGARDNILCVSDNRDIEYYKELMSDDFREKKKKENEMMEQISNKQARVQIDRAAVDIISMTVDTVYYRDATEFRAADTVVCGEIHRIVSLDKTKDKKKYRSEALVPYYIKVDNNLKVTLCDIDYTFATRIE